MIKWEAINDQHLPQALPLQAAPPPLLPRPRVTTPTTIFRKRGLDLAKDWRGWIDMGILRCICWPKESTTRNSSPQNLKASSTRLTQLVSSQMLISRLATPSNGRRSWLKRIRSRLWRVCLHKMTSSKSKLNSNLPLRKSSHLLRSKPISKQTKVSLQLRARNASIQTKQMLLQPRNKRSIPNTLLNNKSNQRKSSYRKCFQILIILTRPRLNSLLKTIVFRSHRWCHTIKKAMSMGRRGRVHRPPFILRINNPWILCLFAIMTRSGSLFRLISAKDRKRCNLPRFHANRANMWL